MTFATVDNRGIVRSLTNIGGLPVNMDILRKVTRLHKRRRRRTSSRFGFFADNSLDNIASVVEIGKPSLLFRFLHSYANFLTLVVENESQLQDSLRETYCGAIQLFVHKNNDHCIIKGVKTLIEKCNKI